MAFRGKVALVTGGGSGMGQRACERLALEGARVAALDINGEGLEKTATSSDRITTYRCDVTDSAAVDEVVARVGAELGPIDRTVAAAGIMPTDLLVDMPVETMFTIMDVNYKGVVNTVMATLPGMLERRRGDQIIFSSLTGFLPVMHFGAYCASKAAVKMFAEILAHENQESGLRFAIVCPPMVQTPLLAQVTSNPKVMSEGDEPMPADDVLDAIEDDLERGRLYVLPGEAAKGARAARLIPGLIWKNMHKIEGR